MAETRVDDWRKSNCARSVWESGTLHHHKSNCSPNRRERHANALKGAPKKGILCQTGLERAYNRVSVKTINYVASSLVRPQRRKSNELKHVRHDVKLFMQLHYMRTRLQNVTDVTSRVNKEMIWQRWRRDDADEGTINSRSEHNRNL